MACAMSSSTAFLVARYTSGREHYLLCLEFPGARMVWKLFKCVSTQSNIFMKSIETRTVSTSQKHLTSPSQNVWKLHILYIHSGVKMLLGVYIMKKKAAGVCQKPDGMKRRWHHALWKEYYEMYLVLRGTSYYNNSYCSIFSCYSAYSFWIFMLYICIEGIQFWISKKTDGKTARLF
jgi:hypothetical protein